MPDTCELCGRAAPTTFHHLIPRTLHRNKWFKKRFTRQQMADGLDLCRQCHGAVHEFIDHKELAREYHTKQALLAHPKVANFVKWVAKQKVRHEGR